MIERILLIFLVSLFVTLILIKFYIKKAEKKKLVVRDMYKSGEKMVANMGGLVVLTGAMLGLIVAEFLGINMVPLLLFYFVVILYGFYGLADDLLGFKKRQGKVLVLFILALPIAVLTKDTNLSLLLFEIELGWMYAFIFAPLYIMVVANLINMHSGYNGLAGGLSLIILIFAGVKSYLVSGWAHNLLIIPILGALLAFMFFNLYPSRIFLGNIGSFLLGGAIGGFLVLANIEFFGVIILIPHIINFILWIYWTRNMDKYPFAKFGKVREDGTIKTPNYLTVKYIVCKLFRVNEWQAILICYSVTIVFGVVGLVI